MSGDAPALLARLHAAWDALRERMDAAAKQNDWLAFRGMAEIADDLAGDAWEATTGHAGAPPAPGPTGEHPRGKLAPDDEGELQLTVAATDDGAVVVAFGKAVAWLGMSPNDARDLAEMLVDRAALADRAAFKRRSP